ncbi:hypothetical protein R1flu_003371 [Riccia fluitans]|uniref:Cytochrome P450 n=1 Tax=Riccia fluitans TaxID=41844 RepID=A0ABD1Y8U1_9MARC
MESQWTSVEKQVWTTVLALSLTLFLIIVRRGRKTSKNYRMPPGPWGFPVLGTIPRLAGLTHEVLTNFAKNYGPLMTLKLGSKSVVVASSSKVAEEFLKANDRVWASRPPGTVSNVLSYNCSDLIFSAYGPRWRYARKIFMVDLLSARRISSFQAARKQEILRAVNDAITGSCSGTVPVQLDILIRRTSTNIVMRMLMNEQNLTKSPNDRKISEDFHQAVKDAFELLESFYVGDFIPWLDWLDPQGLKKKLSAVSKKCDTMWQGILDDHKRKLEAARGDQATDGSKSEEQDIVDALLTRLVDDDDGENLTEVEMKALIMNIIFARTDTTSNGLQAVLGELLKNPSVMEKTQAKMDSVVGRKRLVEESDLPNLPYLNAIVKENFRLHPPGPILIPHISTEDSEILGYEIPAGTTLFVNIHAIHRDPALYERPLDFYPERFLGSEKDVHGFDFDLLPFGAGRRMCPGKSLGLAVVVYTAALYIQTCDLRLPENVKPEDLTDLIALRRSSLLQILVHPQIPKDLVMF